MYTINRLIADNAGLVVALDWVYSNADGSISAQHRLSAPEEGSTLLPFEDVTEEVALGWLTAQLANTTEEFDAAIAKRKAEQEYADQLAAYTVSSEGAPVPYSEPVDESAS